MNFKVSGVARWFIIGVAVIMVSTGWGHPAPNPNRGIDDALKYLQELDRLYSHVAMPSLRSDRGFPGSSGGRTMDMENMMKLHQLDKLYSDRIRPRFGKRTSLKHTFPDYDIPNDDNDKDWLALSDGR